MTLDTSGERVTLHSSSARNQEDHLARYNFAKNYIVGKKVLDIACGTGYGAKMLSDAGAAEVIGIDLDNEAINYAKENYSDDRTYFYIGDAAFIDLQDKSIDVIITFETIEHLEDDKRFKYLQELRRVLKDNGLILLSTPNKRITSPRNNKPNNPFHVLEFNKQTLHGEIQQNSLDIVEWYGQRFVKKIFTYHIVYILVRLFEKVLIKNFHIYDYADSPEVRPLVKNIEPRYFVVMINKRI